jgi:gas vesicle protein
MTFLWIVVVLMALALLAEIGACIGLAVVASRSSRKARVFQKEIQDQVRQSKNLVEGLKTQITPQLETIHKNSSEVVSLVSHRARMIKAVAQDTQRRSQLVRLRLRHEGIQTVEQLREGQDAVRGGILPPIDTLRKVIRGVGIALWILRRVA